jgi:hypothetical protein
MWGCGIGGDLATTGTGCSNGTADGVNYSGNCIAGKDDDHNAEPSYKSCTNGDTVIGGCAGGLSAGDDTLVASNCTSGNWVSDS